MKLAFNLSTTALSLCAVCCSNVLHTQAQTPLILLAGQSNMVGSPNEAGERYEQDVLARTNTIQPGLTFDNLLPLLVSPAMQQTNITTEFRRELVDLLTRILGYVHNGTDVVPEHQVDLLIELGQRFPTLYTSLADPLGNVYCSDVTPPIAVQEFMSAVPLSPNSGCGNPYGPELVLGHTLGFLPDGKESGSDLSFIMPKVSRGGTQIRGNWSKAEGDLWSTLQSRIAHIDSVSTQCQTGSGCSWDAFVWFQGENDSMDQPNAENYEGDLITFLADVRAELFAAGTRYAAPEEIPVVIVQIGSFFRAREFGTVVARAQASVAASDAFASIVWTDDLGTFYHYDASSQLIIGDRVARALEGLWKGTIVMPPLDRSWFGSCQQNGQKCHTNAACCGGKCAYSRCGT
jgi:hypothetical protein